jgi:hypothetical protein
LASFPEGVRKPPGRERTLEKDLNDRREWVVLFETPEMLLALSSISVSNGHVTPNALAERRHNHKTMQLWSQTFFPSGQMSERKREKMMTGRENECALVLVHGQLK